MTLTEAKKFVRTVGVYSAIEYLSEAHTQEDTDAVKEIVFRVLDNLRDDIFYRAYRKGTK